MPHKHNAARRHRIGKMKFKGGWSMNRVFVAVAV
jgi:hypothetical protein